MPVGLDIYGEEAGFVVAQLLTHGCDGWGYLREGQEVVAYLDERGTLRVSAHIEIGDDALVGGLGELAPGRRLNLESWGLRTHVGDYHEEEQDGKDEVGHRSHIQCRNLMLLMSPELYHRVASCMRWG